MIDISILHDFSRGDKAFELDVIQTYIDESDEFASLLETNLIQGNVSEIGRIAHKLKSSISVFGFKEFHQLLNKLEDYCNQQSPHELLNSLVLDVLNYNKNLTAEMLEIKAEYSKSE